MDLYATAVAAAVGILFVPLAAGDARTSQVPVRGARLATAVAVAGLGGYGLIVQAWNELAGSALGAALVTGIQLVPYWVQRRSTEDWIGRADVRLALPFGWTLGWFGLWFAVAGFAMALVSGLTASLLTRRTRIPFVPFMTFGLWAGLALALSRR
jgi:prepilin signal peptidase PulO-like enzyme (type II secretory pathway)